MSGHNVFLSHKGLSSPARPITVVSGRRGDLKVAATPEMAMPRSA